MSASTFTPKAKTAEQQVIDDLIQERLGSTSPIHMETRIQHIEAGCLPPPLAYGVATTRAAMKALVRGAAKTAGSYVPPKKCRLSPAARLGRDHEYVQHLIDLYAEDGTGLSKKIRELYDHASANHLNHAWVRLAPNKNLVLILDPDDIKKIVFTQKPKLVLHDSTGSFEKIFGDKNVNIFTVAPGPELDALRAEFSKVLQSHTVLKQYIGKMQAIVTSHLKKITDNNLIIDDLENDLANSIAMEAISFCHLGMTQIANETKEKITQIIRKIATELCKPYDQIIKKLVPQHIGPLKTGEYYQAIAKKRFFKKYILNETIPDLMDLGRDIVMKELIPPNADTMLHTMNWLNPQYDAEQKKTPEEQVDLLFSDTFFYRLILFLVVGHETSANPIKFALMLLSDPKYAHMVQKIRDELQANPPETWTDENFPNTPYLSAIIKETLRLYPPLNNLFFEGKEDLDFSGGTVDTGDMVVISPEYTHLYQTALEKQDPLHWKHNPQQFNPERFLMKAEDGETRMRLLTDYEYFPFGFNPRKCLGQFFALQEAKITLARILDKYDVQCTVTQNGERQPVAEPYPCDQVFTRRCHIEKIQMVCEPRQDLEEKIDVKPLLRAGMR